MTDGEFRRTSWHMDFIYQLGGVTRTDEELVVQFRNDEGTGQFIAAGLAVCKPLHLDEPIFIDDYRFLAGAARKSMPKYDHPVAEHGAPAQRHRRPHRLEASAPSRKVGAEVGGSRCSRARRRAVLVPGVLGPGGNAARGRLGRRVTCRIFLDGALVTKRPKLSSKTRLLD